MGRDTVQLETVVSTISQEYLLEFTSEYGISEDLHPELPGPEERIVDFLEGKRVFPTVADWRTSAPKDEMPSMNTYSAKAVTILNTHCTLIQKQPEALLCLVGLSQRYYLGDDVYPIFLHDDDRGGNGRSSHSNRIFQGTLTHEKVTAGLCQCKPSQQSTDGNATKDQGQGSVSPKVRPPENVATTGVVPEAGQAEEIAAIGPYVIKECHKRGNDKVDTNAPSKVLRRDHAESQLTQSTIRGKSLAAMEIGMGSTCPVLTSRDAPVGVSDPDLLSFTNPYSIPTKNVAQ
nr:hypothetical protein [Tanacetum cinerariifolium]